MVYLSDQALGTDTFPEESGIFRRITHDPIGVVYVIVSVIILLMYEDERRALLL